MESGESSEVQSISRELITPIATSLTASLILLGSAALLVSPFGHPIMLLPQFVAAVILVGCLFILPFHLARLCLDRKRIESARVLLWVVFLILFLLPSLIFSQKIRIEGMRAIPESASPILKALREYQGKYGRWPM
ncbi:MAG: hypothetical protein KC931_14465, partial [Candidatus Omnitrophica bacterium]|nr:hypothetical protein [Candidatus Omnitrophota bacterium]